MKKFWMVLSAFMALTLVLGDADARRLGGGRNLGIQRSAPAQQQAAPQAPARQQQAAPATPSQQPAGTSKWLGPLAGLGLGAGLAALFLHNGWTGLLAGLLLIGLMVALAALVVRALRGGMTRERLQYAGGSGMEPTLGALAGGAGAQSIAAASGRWPAGFDAPEFIRHARLNFVRLQKAHDRRDASTLRDFLAPDVYREVEADIRAGGAAPQHTEVLTLEAEVLDVAEEAGSYRVSVRFSGLIREAPERDAEPFSEVWHLEKPMQGRSGWLVAGIQQA